MKEELLKLAERVEALRGPDWEVDKLIAVLNGWCLHPSNRQRDDSAQSDTGYTCLDCGADSWGNTGPTGQKRSASLPAYTASLDAAMTLVPGGENGRWNAGKFNVDPNKCSAQVAIEDEIFIERGSLGRGIKVRASGTARTPALALCAAALRALAKEE